MLFVEIEPLPPRTCDAPVPHDHMLSPRTCDALVPHDHRLPPGGGTPSSHTITATALRALRNKWPEGGPSPCSPQEVGRPRPTRSQPPRSARYETNGPRAGHLPAPPRRWDALVPHDHSHRAPRATKQMARGRAISLLSPRRWDALVPHDHSHRAPRATKQMARGRAISLLPQGGGTPSSHTITATAPRALRNKWPEGGPSPCSPQEVGRPRPTRSQPPRSARSKIQLAPEGLCSILHPKNLPISRNLD